MPTTDQMRNATRALTVLAGTLPFVPSQVHRAEQHRDDGLIKGRACLFRSWDVTRDIVSWSVPGHVASIYRTIPVFGAVETNLSASVTNAPIEPYERITLTLRRSTNRMRSGCWPRVRRRPMWWRGPWCITTRCYRPGWCMAPRRRTGSSTAALRRNCRTTTAVSESATAAADGSVDDFAPGAAATQTVEGLGQNRHGLLRSRRSFP